MKVFKKGELSELWIFYLGAFIHAFSVMIMPFFVVYFLDLGFSFFNISLLLAGYGLSIFLFEIPTGAVADGFGRKYSVMIGLLISAISMALIPFFTTFWPLFLLWCLAGFGTTFISGAGDAWVVDNLSAVKKESLVHEYYIKLQSISGIALVISPLISVWVVKEFSITPLWYVFASGLFLMFLLYSLAPEFYKPAKISLKNSFHETIRITKKGFYYFFSQRSLILLLLGSLAFVFMNFAGDAWEPFMVLLGLPTYALGYLLSALGLLLIIVSFASRYLSRYSVRSVLFLTVMFDVILLGALFFIAPPLVIPGIIVYLLSDIGSMVRSPLISTFEQELIPKNIRATVTSTKTMIISFVAIIATVIGGGLIDIMGMQFTLAIQAVFGIVALLVYRKLPDVKIKT